MAVIIIDKASGMTSGVLVFKAEARNRENLGISVTPEASEKIAGG